MNMKPGGRKERKEGGGERVAPEKIEREDESKDETAQKKRELAVSVLVTLKQMAASHLFS